MSESPTLSLQRHGAVIDLLMPSFRAMDLGAIALSLAEQRRYCGNCPRGVSVAEHSLVVASLSPERFRLAALLHDAHEALIGDIPRPVEAALCARMGELGEAFLAALATQRRVIDFEIAMLVLTLVPGFAGENAGSALHVRAASGLEREMQHDAVMMADAAAGLMERRAFFPAPPGQARLSETVIADVRARYVLGEASVPDIAQAWLGALEHLVEARFGQQRTMLPTVVGA